MTSKRIQNITTKSHTLGIVTNKPRIAYDSVQHLNPSSISAGFVDHTEIDPAAIKYAFETQRSFTQAARDRMDRGTLMHMMLLQPERLGSDVAIWPAGKARRGGTESKPSEWDEFNATFGHKLIICQEDYDIVSEAHQAIRFHPVLTELLTNLDETDLTPQHCVYTATLHEIGQVKTSQQAAQLALKIAGYLSGGELTQDQADELTEKLKQEMN
jgi:hypothetical protein